MASDEIMRQIKDFLALIDTNQSEARQVIQANSRLGQALLGLMKEELKRKENASKNIPMLLKHYLMLANNATVLCLGSGTGVELMAARKVVPNGRIIGIDNSHHRLDTSSTIVYELAGRAEFYPWDLNTINPEQVIDSIGGEGPPHAIIARHPNLHQNPQWPRVLTEWGNFTAHTRIQFLVTTFHQVERSLIQRAMTQAGVPFILDSWKHGDRTFDQATQTNVIHDRFILGVNIRK